jgi:hypothetical protein
MEFRLQSGEHAPAQTNVPPSKMMTFVRNGIERGEGNVGMFPFSLSTALNRVVVRVFLTS